MHMLFVMLIWTYTSHLNKFLHTCTWRITHTRAHHSRSKKVRLWCTYIALACRFRAIGVSNYTEHHLSELLAVAEVQPMVNQVLAAMIHTNTVSHIHFAIRSTLEMHLTAQSCKLSIARASMLMHIKCSRLDGTVSCS